MCSQTWKATSWGQLLDKPTCKMAPYIRRSTWRGSSPTECTWSGKVHRYSRLLSPPLRNTKHQRYHTWNKSTSYDRINISRTTSRFHSMFLSSVNGRRLREYTGKHRWFSVNTHTYTHTNQLSCHSTCFIYCKQYSDLKVQLRAPCRTEW